LLDPTRALKILSFSARFSNTSLLNFVAEPARQEKEGTKAMSYVMLRRGM
jgi:hypothetical protein